MNENYKELAAAIIQRAVLDYATLLKNPYCGISKTELEQFFRSDYFTLLSDGMSADYIMRKVKEMVS